MLVYSLSQEELKEQLKIDLAEVFLYSERKQMRVDQMIKKSRLFPFYISSKYTSSRKNKWLIWWMAQSKQNVGDYSLTTFVCINSTQMGRYAYLPTFVQKEIIWIIFTPHFFSRFAERMNIDLTGEELIMRYFKYNAGYGFMDKVEYFAKNAFFVNCYGSTKEGVAMGLKSKNDIILFKTFVSYNMLKGEQIETFASTEKIRKEIQEKDLII